MSSKHTLYAVLTPFKRGGVIVKPPRTLNLSDEEALALIVEGLVGVPAASGESVRTPAARIGERQPAGVDGEIAPSAQQDAANTAEATETDAPTTDETSPIAKPAAVAKKAAAKKAASKTTPATKAKK